MNLTQALEIFGLTFEELKNTNRSQLREKYLQLAQKTHPDRGGVAEDFIKLQESYKRLKQEIPEDKDSEQRDLDKFEGIEKELIFYYELTNLFEEIKKTLEIAENQTQEIIKNFEEKREKLQKAVQECTKELQIKQNSWVYKFFGNLTLNLTGTLQRYEERMKELKEEREVMEKDFLQQVSNLYGSVLQQIKEKMLNYFENDPKKDIYKPQKE